MSHKKARTSAAVFDTLQMLRKTADGSLTTTGTYDGVAIYETAARGASMKVVVPAAEGSSPLAYFVVQAADTDDDGCYNEIARSETVGAAGEYLVGFSTQRTYVRLSVEISGQSPDFGAVQAGVVMLGV